MNSSNPHADILDFLRHWFNDPQLGIGSKSLSQETTLENDLGICGDDAFEFMEELCDRFEIDPTGISFDRYFSPEGFYVPFMTNFLRWIFRLKPIKPDPLYDLTLRDMERIIVAKKWIDPPELDIRK